MATQTIGVCSTEAPATSWGCRWVRRAATCAQGGAAGLRERAACERARFLSGSMLPLPHKHSHRPPPPPPGPGHGRHRRLDVRPLRRPVPRAAQALLAAGSAARGTAGPGLGTGAELRRPGALLRQVGGVCMRSGCAWAQGRHARGHGGGGAWAEDGHAQVAPHHPPPRLYSAAPLHPSAGLPIVWLWRARCTAPRPCLRPSAAQRRTNWTAAATVPAPPDCSPDVPASSIEASGDGAQRNPAYTRRAHGKPRLPRPVPGRWRALWGACACSAPTFCALTSILH